MSRSRTFRPRVEVLEDRCVPATFTVKNLLDGPAATPPANSLRAAIKAANDNGIGLDTIVFKLGLEGTIKLTDGEIGITGNLTVLGPGAAKIAVSGNFASRIFNIDGGFAGADLTVTLQGLELRHGMLTTDTDNGGAINSAENLKLTKMTCVFNQVGVGAGFADGGAIACTGNLTVAKSRISGNTTTGTFGEGGGIFGDTVTITDSTISGNTGNLGGGIKCNTATITRSTISGNTTTDFIGSGGGIYCNTTATITNSTIFGNRATKDGGGIFSLGTLSITGCTISSNQAVNQGGGIHGGAATITKSTITGNTAGSSGGGLWLTGGSLTLTNCTVNGNSAGSDGGGINLSNASAHISASTIAGNTAVKGGGLNLLNGLTALIRNSTISGNQAGTKGGGLYSTSTNIDFHNCTIAFNQAGSTGGGISSTGGGIDLQSTINALNSATDGNPDLDSGTTSYFAAFSLIGDPTVEMDANFSDGGNNLFGLDPQLAPLAFNGGKTQTHALKKGSPAINQGMAVTIIGLPDLTTDQRGGLFKRKVGGAVDIGAFERQ